MALRQDIEDASLVNVLDNLRQDHRHAAAPLSTPRSSAIERGDAPQAVLKTHRVLFVLRNFTSHTALQAHEICQLSSLSSSDMSKALSRLMRAGRVSRRKEPLGERPQYFRYWLSAEQKAEFDALTPAYGLPLRRPQPSLGDSRLDALVELGGRYRTSLADIQSESDRLTQELRRLKSQVALAQERRDLLRAEVEHYRCASTTDCAPRLVPMGAAALAERLAFIKGLRKRPALADLALLRKVEDDYYLALRRTHEQEEAQAVRYKRRT